MRWTLVLPPAAAVVLLVWCVWGCWCVAAPPVSRVITLPRNADRLAGFLASYQASDLAGTEVRSLRAVDGQEVRCSDFLSPEALQRLEAMRRTGVRQAHPDLTPGGVGCYLSHMRAWQLIAESDAPYGFVFEDDAEIAPDTLARFTRAAAGLGSDWDIILLGYEGDGVPAQPGVMRMTRFLRLHAYAVSARAARRLRDSMLPIRQQVDWEMSERMERGELRVYGLRPAAVGVKYQGTDIQVPLQSTA